MYVDFGHCGSDPCSAEQRAQERETRKDDLLPELNKFPSWTSAHVVMPQVLGLAYICFHEGKDYSNSGNECRCKHTPCIIDTPFFSVLLFFFFFSLYPTYLRHFKMSRSNSWNVGRKKIPSSLPCKRRSPSSSVRLQGELWALGLLAEPLPESAGLFYSCFLRLDLCSYTWNFQSWICLVMMKLLLHMYYKAQP